LFRFWGLFGSWREVRVCAKGKWLQILLLLDSDDHLLKIVGRDMSFAAATSTVDRILSSDLRMRDVESCGGGS